MSEMNYEFKIKEDLQNLIENKIVENQQLEFKRYSFPNGKVSSSDKDKLLKEITALANSEGGNIIIGIDEDGKGIASNLVDVGCDITQFDNIQLAIEQYMLAKIRPRLYGVSMQPIKLENDKIDIVINVPKSFSRPHAVNDGNKDNFYIRHSNGITSMSVDDLRKQFIFSTSFKSQIKEFRRDRIGMILSKECIGNLADGAMVLIHIIPLWSLDIGNQVDIKQLQTSPFNKNTDPISGGSWNNRYNADGFCRIHLDYESKQVDSYSQFFRDGIIEALDIRMMNFNNNFQNQVYDWMKSENAVYEAIERYTKLLNQLNIPKPWYIYISLLNAKGFRTDNFYYGTSEIIDRNIVHATEGIWNDDNEILDKVIKGTFDSLANAFGMPQSPNYNEKGEYIIR